MTEMKACIFDLDGVLVDTAKYHYLAWKRLANELGFDFTEQDNERLKGVSRMRCLEILLELGKKELPQEEKEPLAAKKNVWYVEYITKMQDDEILPGVKKLLGELRARGIKCAVGSASKNTMLILRRLQLVEYFDAVSDGTQTTQTKPDPEVFLKAADMLGIPTGQCVVFEDAAAGVEAAKRAGMTCIGVGKPEMLQGADMVIRGVHDITVEEMVTQLVD
ncbi:MAG: beta-phosphoglucomutase [bacterium]|nr:beta-phosphoglucomutase [bacterium]